MNEQGTFVAALLDSSRKAYAAGTVLRVQEAGSEGAAFVESWGFQALVVDVELRLQHLAEALACGRPELFVLDLEWLAETYRARGISIAGLRASLQCLREELAAALPDPGASLADESVARALDALAGEGLTPSTDLDSEAPHVELAFAFLEAVLSGERRRAERVVFDALDGGVSVAALHLDVIVRAQVEMGRLWQTGEIDVADEHFGSRIVEDVLALLRSRMECAAPNGRSVLVASVSGNLHDIGARIVADRFEMCGWRALFLGANMPSDGVAHAAKSMRPDLIALSAGLALNVRAAAEAIATLRRTVPGVPILVGGRPFAAVEGLWEDVGADAWAADPDAAVRTGLGLVGG